MARASTKRASTVRASTTKRAPTKRRDYQHPNAPPQGARTFTQFSHLPAEIRRKIWRLTFRARIVSLAYRRGQVTSTTAAPVALHVNQESRSEAMEFYDLIFDKPSDNISSGTVSPGTVSPGTVTSGIVPSGTVSSGTVSSGTVSSGTVSSGTVSSGSVSSGTVSSGYLYFNVQIDTLLFSVESFYGFEEDSQRLVTTLFPLDLLQLVRDTPGISQVRSIVLERGVVEHILLFLTAANQAELYSKLPSVFTSPGNSSKAITNTNQLFNGKMIWYDKQDSTREIKPEHFLFKDVLKSEVCHFQVSKYEAFNYFLERETGMDWTYAWVGSRGLEKEW